LHKTDTSLDLAMAMALLAESRQVEHNLTDRYLFLGELSLEGFLNPVRGIIGKILSAKSRGVDCFYIPRSNLEQAMLIPDITLKAASCLKDVYLDLSKTLPLKSIKTMDGVSSFKNGTSDYLDLSEITGQPIAKRALEIAAAGHHNILFDGPPGTGKTMLAKAICGILPDLSHSEVLEVTHLHSLTNNNYSSIVTARPFRSPHHTASTTSLIGGGSTPKPGEATLAHRGVLFLDEFPEFSHSCLEALRQPLEDGTVSIARVKDSASYPADFILAATQNPCPCGYLGSNKLCVCSPPAIYRYQRKLSGPILDRIDLHLNVQDVDHRNLLTKKPEGSQSKEVKSRVISAYGTQYKRFNTIRYNSSMTNKDIRKLAKLTDQAKDFLDNAAEKLSLSARSYIRIVKVARTIADLSEETEILTPHISEAIQYRHKKLFDAA
jgi:magnesium chelatase family protein